MRLTQTACVAAIFVLMVDSFPATAAMPRNSLPSNGAPVNGMPTNGTSGNGLPNNASSNNGAPRNGAVPEGATAKCKDGTFTWSKTRAEACRHHGGIAKWLAVP